MDNKELDLESKRGRGRPKKEVEPTDLNAEKRGRGRPRKEVDETAEQGEKRGRGRPKKPTDPEVENQPKKARGRPPKFETPTVLAKERTEEPATLSVTQNQSEEISTVAKAPAQVKKGLFGRLKEAVTNISNQATGANTQPDVPKEKPSEPKQDQRDSMPANRPKPAQIESDAKLEAVRSVDDLPVFAFRNSPKELEDQKQNQSRNRTDRPERNRNGNRNEQPIPEAKTAEVEASQPQAKLTKKLFGKQEPRKIDSETKVPISAPNEPEIKPEPVYLSAKELGLNELDELPLPFFRAKSKGPVQSEAPSKQVQQSPRQERQNRNNRDEKIKPAFVRQVLDDETEAEIQAEADQLVSFRTPTGEPRQKSESTTEFDLLGRKKRVRNRQDDRNQEQDEPINEDFDIDDIEDIEDETAIVPAAVVKTRQVVAIPSNAPQVVVRDLIPILVRDGQVYLPFFFFANVQDERRMQVIEEEIRDAYESGLRVFVHQLDLIVNSESSEEIIKKAQFLLEKTLTLAPEAQVIFKVAFKTREGWEYQFPGAKYRLKNGQLGAPSFSDEDFWEIAESRISELVKQLRSQSNADHLMGFQIDRNEWFNPADAGYDTSPAALEGFKNWAKKRYRNDVVSLCAAWFDGSATFDNLEFPAYSSGHGTGEKFVRTGLKTKKWVDFHLFLSDIIVERIGQLSHAIKLASEGMCVVGVSYGYTFEWSHPDSGHLSLGKLLRNPEVDFIAGPPSYKSREPGGTAAFGTPIDSIAINGKLFISEEDFKTPISGRTEPDEHNPVLRTPQALENAHWRGIGAAVAHSSGVSWMDLWGNGWLNSHGTWERAARVKETLALRMAVPVIEPDVAVFIDERSLAYLVDQKAFTLLVQNVRESILRSGLNAKFYLLSDLAHRENFPEAKLYVFMNAWDVRPEVRSAIKSRLQKDGKVLFWLYAAGLFESGREALERVREVTGIAIKRQPFASQSGTVMVHRKHPLCEAIPEELLASGGTLEPSYFAIPEDGVVLAEYISTGLPSFVLKDFKNEGQDWTSVFLGESVVTPALFRALGQLAGVHVWSYQEDSVQIQTPFLSVHCRGAGNRTIVLPDRFVAYSLMSQDWVPIEGLQMRFQATDGSTHNFLVGIKTDIQAILNKPMDELMKIEELPERKSDTVNLDEMLFDVPIMKLDSWMDETWSDEFAEELFVNPQTPETEVFDSRTENAITNASGSNSYQNRDNNNINNNNNNNNNNNGGGNKRGRRRERGQNDNRNKRSNDFDVMEMNVVFRKRD